MPLSTELGKLFSKGGVVDMRDGGVVGMAQGGQTTEEQEFDPYVNKKFWEQKFSKDIKRVAKEEKEVRPRKNAAEELSQLEKAVDVSGGGLPKAYTYMTSYGTRRKPTFDREGALGEYHPTTKEVYVAP